MILLLTEFSFAEIHYKCTFYNTKLKISEEFLLEPPQPPLKGDSKVSYRFGGRELFFDFWKASRPQLPDTIAISILNGGMQNQDMQFSYPIAKISWRTDLDFYNSESLYCYDLTTYRE